MPRPRRFLLALIVVLATALLVIACSGSGYLAPMPDAGHGRDASDGGSKGERRRDAAGTDRDAFSRPDGNAPYLSELNIAIATAESGTSSALVPAFSPTTYDYYVRCSAGDNAITLTMKASAGAKSLLVQPSLSPALPQQTLSLDVVQDQAIVAVATDGVATTEYWVRCLPQAFPQLQMTRNAKADTAPPGYYVLGNLHTSASSDPYAMILDGNGVPVWYYHATKGPGVCDVDSVLDGSVSFIQITPGAGATATFPFEFHSMSPPMTAYAAPATGPALDEHEIQTMPNGHLLVFADPITSGIDLTGLSVHLNDGGTGHFGAGSKILDCLIQEFDPSSGHVVWQWLMSDHFVVNQTSTYPEETFEPYYSEAGTPLGTVVEVFHCNSMSVDQNNENILVSARNTDSLFYVERPSGRVLWKMGGTNSSKDGATYVKVAEPFFRQHDARLQPDWSPTCTGGSGQISLFDDETGVGAARAAVYQVSVGAGGASDAACDASLPDGGASEGGGPGPATGTASLVWSYAGPSSVNVTGSFRILPDGSRVIGWGSQTVSSITFTEVDEAGNDLLDFKFTDGNISYRSTKVPASEFDISALRAATALP